MAYEPMPETDSPYWEHERDLDMRGGPEPVTKDRTPAPSPCPEDTESLVLWLSEQFPEISPRTSDRDVVDRCIARSGVIDLIHFIEGALEAARKEQQDSG